MENHWSSLGLCSLHSSCKQKFVFDPWDFKIEFISLNDVEKKKCDTLSVVADTTGHIYIVRMRYNVKHQFV